MGCNCEGKKYSISMGCCVPILGPIENYYTKYEIDEMLEEIESAITSGCCITPEEVDEKISAATSGLQETLIAGDNIIISGNVISASGCDCDLSDYYTKEEVDAKIPSLSGYATEQWVEDQHYLTEHQPLKTINGQVISGTGNITISGDTDLSDYYTKEEVDAKIPSLSGYATEQWVEDQHYISGVDLSDYVTYEDMVEYVGDAYTKEEVDNLFVTKQTFNTYIINLQEQINSLIESISGCCGSSGETQYRWVVVPDDYVCSGTTKMTKEKEQSSTDGINWSDTGQYRTGSTVLEYGSADCKGICNTLSAYTSNGDLIIPNHHETYGNLTWKTTQQGNMNINSHNITSVTISDCVTTIGDSSSHVVFGVFGSGDYNYSNLVSITMPSGITKLYSDCIRGCRSLISVTCHAATPPIMQSYVFTSTPIENGNGVIYVPAASVDAYKAANNWSNYADKIQAIP